MGEKKVVVGATNREQTVAHIFNDAVSVLSSEKPGLLSAPDSQTKLLDYLIDNGTRKVTDQVKVVAGAYENSAQHELEAIRVKKAQTELIELNKHLDELSFIDHMTGLPNKRYFDSQLEKDVALVDRDGLPLGLAMIDANNFKAVNDTWGHPAGDEVLRIIGQAITGVMRKTDLVARYGGDELALIMPLLRNREEFFGDEKTYKHEDGSKSMFLRINEKVGELIKLSGDKFPSGFKWDPRLELDGVPIYLSAGVGFLKKSEDHNDLPKLQASLIADADSEMYEFKKQRDPNRKA